MMLSLHTYRKCDKNEVKPARDITLHSKYIQHITQEWPESQDYEHNWNQ